MQDMPNKPELPPRDETYLPTGSVVILRSEVPVDGHMHDGLATMTIFDEASHTKTDGTLVRSYHCDWLDDDGRLNRSFFLREQLIHLPHVEAQAREEASAPPE